MTRCDMCGPYTPEQAAALVVGAWKPTRTGHLCDDCRPLVAESARLLADAIDARAVEMFDAFYRSGRES